ncbi:hypothetical protein YC2023_099427 [Brassica napus]
MPKDVVVQEVVQEVVHEVIQEAKLHAPRVFLTEAHRCVASSHQTYGEICWWFIYRKLYSSEKALSSSCSKPL